MMMIMMMMMIMIIIIIIIIIITLIIAGLGFGASWGNGMPPMYGPGGILPDFAQPASH